MLSERDVYNEGNVSLYILLSPLPLLTKTFPQHISVHMCCFHGQIIVMLEVFKFIYA